MDFQAHPRFPDGSGDPSYDQMTKLFSSRSLISAWWRCPAKRAWQQDNWGQKLSNPCADRGSARDADCDSWVESPPPPAWLAEVVPAWRQQRRPPLQAAKALWGAALPLLVSAGLVAWLFWRFSFHDVLSAALQLPWQWLLPLTAGMVLALYAWDGLCLPATYGMEHSPLCYLSARLARGLSYLVGAFQLPTGRGSGGLERLSYPEDLLHCHFAADALALAR